MSRETRENMVRGHLRAVVDLVEERFIVVYNLLQILGKLGTWQGFISNWVPLRGGIVRAPCAGHNEYGADLRDPK